MAVKNQDLHGAVPDKHHVALLLIDMINDMEFEGGEKLYPHALDAARCIADLKARCKRAGIPVIYVNDNFGRWQSDLRTLLAHSLENDVRGRPIVELLQPDEDDYFVLKPKQSGFFSTTLDTLLNYLGTRTVILTGVAGNICVLYTAIDAAMRDFHVVVPSDCMASNETELNEQALQHMAHALKADITPSDELDLEQLEQR